MKTKPAVPSTAWAPLNTDIEQFYRSRLPRGCGYTQIVMCHRVKFFLRLILLCQVGLSISCRPIWYASVQNVDSWADGAPLYSNSLHEKLDDQLICRISTNKSVYKRHEEPRLMIEIENHSKYNVVLSRYVSLFGLQYPKGSVSVTDLDGKELLSYGYILCGTHDRIDSTYFFKIGPGQRIVLHDFAYPIKPSILRPAIDESKRPLYVKVQVSYDSAAPDTTYYYLSPYVYTGIGGTTFNIPDAYRDLIDAMPRVRLESNSIELKFE